MSPSTVDVPHSPNARQPYLGPSTERRVTSRIGWSAILAGTAISVALWATLHTLGMGAGLTAIDPDDAGTLKGAGIGTGVWSLIAPALALFVGGLVAGRVVGVFDRSLSAIHGGVVWALTTVLGVTLLVYGLSAAIGGTAQLAGDAAQGTASLVARGAAAFDGDGAMDALGLSGDDLVAPINGQLREQGKPEVTPAQVQTAIRHVIGDALRSGELDRGALVATLARDTRLTPAQADDVATRVEARWEQQKQELLRKAEAAKAAALQAAESTGKALLMVFASMALSLLAAALGAIAGASWWRRQVAR